MSSGPLAKLHALLGFVERQLSIHSEKIGGRSQIRPRKGREKKKPQRFSLGLWMVKEKTLSKNSNHLRSIYELFSVQLTSFVKKLIHPIHGVI
jgi:hypothetical protein